MEYDSSNPLAWTLLSTAIAVAVISTTWITWNIPFVIAWLS